MILLALALATPAPSASNDLDADIEKMNAALEQLEAERAAATPTATPPPAPLSYDIKLDPPMPAASPLRGKAPEVNCSGPLCVYEPIPDGRPSKAARPPEPWHVAAQRTALRLWPIMPALAAAFAFWCYCRPRWRAWMPTGRHILTNYWREIGLFIMLTAIFLKLW